MSDRTGKIVRVESLDQLRAMIMEDVEANIRRSENALKRAQARQAKAEAEKKNTGKEDAGKKA